MFIVLAFVYFDIVMTVGNVFIEKKKCRAHGQQPYVCTANNCTITRAIEWKDVVVNAKEKNKNVKI